MQEIKAVEVHAELRQIKTMADGTMNVVLNLPEDCKEQCKILLDWLGYEVGAVIASAHLNGGENGQGRKGKIRKGA